MDRNRLADTVSGFQEPRLSNLGDLLFQAVPAQRSVSKGTPGFTARKPSLRERLATAIGGDNRESYQKAQGFLGDRPGSSPEANVARMIDPREAASNFADALQKGNIGEAALEAAGSLPAGKGAMIIGPMAKGFYTPAGRAAKEMMQEGVDRTKILRSTGTFIGPEGVPRQEIPDKAAKFSWQKMSPVEGQSTMQQVLDHPELYENYPELKKLAVFYQRAEPGAGGGTKPNPKGGMPLSIVLNPNMNRDPKTVLMHELQHAIQDIEGMAAGGNPYFRIDQSHPAREIYDDLLNLYKSLPEWKNVPRMVMESKAQEEAAYQYYRRLAGEVEAWTTQERTYLDAAQRREQPFWESGPPYAGPGGQFLKPNIGGTRMIPKGERKRRDEPMLPFQPGLLRQWPGSKL